MRINDVDIVVALQRLKRTVTAKEIAEELGTDDTRAIATAARKPVEDGRITRRYPRKHAVAVYRFVRFSPTSRKV